MAQLPDENVIAMPQPGSRRPVSTIDVSGYARGAAAIGSGVETLGKGVASAAQDVAAVLQKEREAEQKLGNAGASASLQAGLLEDASAIDAETDPTDLEERYTAKANERVQAAKRLIKDERQQQLFELSQQDNIARVIQAAKKKQFTLLRDGEMAADIASMNLARDSAIRQPATGLRAMELATGTIHGYVDKWVEKGYIDPVKASEYKRKAALDLAEGKLLALPVAEKYEALSSVSAARSAVQFFVDKGLSRHASAGIIGNLLEASSTLNAEQSHDNGTGVGIAGWRLDRRDALMKYAADKGLKWNDRNTQLEFLWHELNTSEKGVLQRLTNAKDVREAAHAFISFERPAGWTAANPELGRGYQNRARNAERVLAGGGGGPYADVVSALPADRLEQMRMQAEREHGQAAAKASHDAFAFTHKALTDAANGTVPLPPRDSIENNPHLSPADRKRALALYDTATAEATASRIFDAKLDDSEGGDIDPHDPTTRRLANRAYAARKRTPEALQRIVERTKIIPDDAAAGLRRMLDSDNIDQVQNAMQLLADMPDQAFVHLKGGHDLAEARETYLAKFTVWGSPAKAAQDYIRERTEAAVTPALARQRRENMNKRLEAMTPEVMQAYLQPAGSDWSAARYEIGGSNAERDRALHQFRNLVREIYAAQRSPDLDEAMAKAASKFKATFGLSTAYGPDPTDPQRKWGEPRLMRFAPSAWSGYTARGGQSALEPDEIDGLIKEAAADYIEGHMGDPSGWRVPHDKIMLRPVDFTRTEQPFMAGHPDRPPKYLVAYEDQRGLIQVVGIWGAKPDVLRAIKARRKQAEFAAGDVAANANIDALEQRPVFQDF